MGYGSKSEDFMKNTYSLFVLSVRTLMIITNVSIYSFIYLNLRVQTDRTRYPLATREKWSRNYGFIRDRAHRTRQKIAEIFTAKRVCLSHRYRRWVHRYAILGNFNHHLPRRNGPLNVSIVYIVTLQHVVKWLFHFVKYRTYHLSHTKALISKTNRWQLINQWKEHLMI